MYRYVIIVLALIHLGLLCGAKPYEELIMPVQCGGKEFCKHKHPAYPTELIEELLNDRIRLYETNHIGVQDRYGPEDGSEVSICTYEEDLLPIYEIIDSNDNLRFVVQSEEKFTQTVRTEVCRNPGRMTENNSTWFTAQNLGKYNITCEQKYLNYKFLVVKLDGRGFEMVSIKNGVPVCCYCRVQNYWE